MSMGAKLRTALLVLKDEGKLPPGIRTVELEKRIADQLTEFGYGPGEIPNRRTFLRHLGDLRALLQPADVTLCHFRDDAVIGISDQEPLTTNEEDEMQAEPRSLVDITMSTHQSLLTVPFDHPIDVALHPNYLQGLIARVRLDPGDGIELRAADFSWIAKILIVSVNKSERRVTTRLQMAPTFLLGSADRSPLYIIEQLNAVEQDYRQSKISQGEYEERVAVLHSLRDRGRHPTNWIATKLVELQRAHDARLLTLLQLQAARQELHALMDDAQAKEVADIVHKLTHPEPKAAVAAPDIALVVTTAEAKQETPASTPAIPDGAAPASSLLNLVADAAKKPQKPATV